MSDNGEQSGGEQGENRMAVGIALGTPFGVVLSVLMDNWGMLGVGIALGAAFGAIPSARQRDIQDDDGQSTGDDVA